MKPTLKAPEIKRLKLKPEKVVSNSAFKFILRRYTTVVTLTAYGDAPSVFTTCTLDRGRCLHSSTFRFILSAFCGIGVHLGVVFGVIRRCQGVLRCIRGCLGCILCQKRLRLS